MKYQDCVEAVQAAERRPIGACAPRLADANINPATGLSTDYLNHFTEAIMLLEMLSSCPECLDDFLGWRPKSYREHFAASRFSDRDAGDRRLRRRRSEPARLPRHAGRHDDRRAEATRAAMSADLAAGVARPRSPSAPPPGSGRWSRAPPR